MTNTEHAETPRGRGIYLLPNLFTLTALFAGFYAIIASIRGVFDNCAIALFVAMVMDTLDGRIARLTQTQTQFGAQLDSLSDMVSFGLAPALILYTWGLQTLGKAGWLVAFFYAACVALRLARFNVQHTILDKRYFRGLPCPAGAAVIASLIWSMSQYELPGRISYVFTAFCAVCISLLMVSNLSYPSFKECGIRGKVPFIVILATVLCYVIISANPPLILLILFVVYAGSGPVSFLIRKRRRKRRLKKVSP